METEADAMMQAKESVKYILRSKDGQKFPVSRDAIRLSGTLEGMFKDLAIAADAKTSETPIDIPEIDKYTLTKVLEWCEQHKTEVQPPRDGSSDYQVPEKIEMDDWDREFFKRLLESEDAKWLTDVLNAANYMSILPLIDQCCVKVAKIFKEKDADYIRKLFNITNDFTSEEEAVFNNETAWA